MGSLDPNLSSSDEWAIKAPENKSTTQEDPRARPGATRARRLVRPLAAREPKATYLVQWSANPLADGKPNVRQRRSTLVSGPNRLGLLLFVVSAPSFCRNLKFSSRSAARRTNEQRPTSFTRLEQLFVPNKRRSISRSWRPTLGGRPTAISWPPSRWPAGSSGLLSSLERSQVSAHWKS